MNEVSDRGRKRTESPAPSGRALSVDEGPGSRGGQAEKEEGLRSARSAARAAWAAAMLAALMLGYNIWSDLNTRQEILNVDATRYFGDYPTELTEWWQTPEEPAGLVAVMWNVVIANNGSQPVSLTRYEVREVVGPENALASYTGLDQGIVDRSLANVVLPLTLPGGEARRVFLRTGLRMAPAAFQVAAEKFDIGQPISMEALRRLLFANGLDIYANQVNKIGDSGWAVDAESRREQLLEIAFFTARGTAVRVPVSWYAISGLGR